MQFLAPRWCSPRLDEARPQRDEGNAHDDRDDETENATDEHPSDQNRGDADPNRHQKSHLVPTGVKEAPQQTDEQAEKNEADDVEHALLLPERGSRETPGGIGSCTAGTPPQPAVDAFEQAPVFVFVCPYLLTITGVSARVASIRWRSRESTR
jgi:hypothetical protein